MNKVLDTLARTMAIQDLVDAEDAFLLAHGWTPVDDGTWTPPAGYSAHKGYHGPESPRDRGHAINSQKARLNMNLNRPRVTK